MPLIKHIGRKKTKVRFDIYFRDIKFSKNEYFVSNSKYSLTLDGYKNGEIFSKNETYTYEDLSKVRIKDSMEFIATLYQNQKERDTNTYQKKEKTLVLRQYSKQLGRKEGVIYRDLIEVALPLDALLTKNSDEEIKLKFHDESVKGHINAVVKFKVLDNSSNNAMQKEQGALPEPTDTSSIIQYKDVNVRQPKEESKNSGGVVPKITGANRQAKQSGNETKNGETSLEKKKSWDRRQSLKSEAGDGEDDWQHYSLRGMRILAEESDAKSSNKEELRKKTSIRLDTLANSSPKRVSREKSLAPANGDAEDFFRMLSISDDLADSRDVALDERRGNGLPPLGTQASTSLDSLDLDVTEEDTNSLMSDVDDLFKTVSSSKARNSKRASKKKSSRAIFDGVSAEKAPSKHLARKDTFYNAVKSFFSSGTDDCEYPEEDYTSVVTIQKIPFKEGDGHFTGSSNLHSGSQNTIVDPYSPSIYRYITGRSSSLSLDTISDKQTLNLKAVDSSSQNTLLRTPSFKGIKPIFSSDRGDSEAELKMLQRQNLQLQTTLKIVVQERDNIETDRTQKRIEIMNYQTLLESLHLDIEALSKELQQAKTAEAIALQQRDEKDIRLRSVLSFIEEKMQSGELRLGLTGGNNRNESVAQDFSVPNLRKAHSFESRASLDKHDARRRSRDSSPTTRAISKKRLQLTSPAIAPLLTPVNDANTINNDKNPVEDWVDDSDFETFVQSHNQEAGVKPAFPSKYSLAYNNVLGGNGYVTDASVGGRLGSNSRVADGSTTNVRPNALSKYNTDQSMQGSKYVLNAAIEPSIKQRSIYSTLHQSDISAKQSKALEGNDQHRNVRHQRKGSDIDQGLQKKIHKVRIIVDDQSNQNNCQNLRFDSQGYEIDQYGIRLADYSH